MLELYIHKISKLKAKINIYQSYLSEDEVKNQNKIINREIATNYLCCRGRLRELLSKKINYAAKNIKFKYNKYGKPSLDSIENHNFNLSHSKNICVILYSPKSPVGVDIEYRDYSRPIKNIANRILSEEEKKLYQEFKSDKEKRFYFFQKWALKESLTKAIGVGMSIPFDKIQPNNQNNIFTFDYQGIWKAKIINFDKNYTLSIAAKRELNNIKIFNCN